MTSTPHFDISAAVVRQLGDELVSDEVTAIVELVKNAYDADADYANVIVDTQGAIPAQQTKFPGTKGFITIDDNGIGMNRADIERGWLTISLSSKREMKAKGETTPKGRTPLGDKGLGRLSTQKLGQNLEMLTRKDGAAETLHVSFSWSAFTDDKSLGSVPVTITPALTARKKGTKLAISDLRNPNVWRGTAVDKLAGDLSQIIFPFAETRVFMVTLSVDGKIVDLGHISERIRNAAVGKFTINYEDGQLILKGKVRLSKFRGNQQREELEFFERYVTPTKGKDFFEYLIAHKPTLSLSYSHDPSYFIEFEHHVKLSDLGHVERISSGKPGGLPAPADPGPFRSEIDEFLLRGDESGLTLGGLTSSTEIQQIVKRHAGIKVFRDGFAVKPYGINGEDWLRLGAQQTSATSWYGLRPHNVVGFVAISEAKNGNLREKTDREGFVANPYSQNFRRLMTHATETIGSFYEWIRRSYNAYRVERMSKGETFRGSQSTVVRARDVSRTLATYAQRAKTVDAATEDVQRKINAVTERIRTEPLLSSAAERRLGELLEAAKEALEASRTISAELQGYAGEAEKLSDIVASLEPRLDVLNTQVEDFSELAGLGLIAEALSHEVQNQTDRLMQRSKGAADKAQRAVPPDIDLLQFAREVTSSASALRRQIAHLGPSLRYQRDRIETFAISKLVQDVRAYFVERWIDKGLALIIDRESDFRVETNRGRLMQVVDNVLLNSEYWLGETGAEVEGERPTAYIKMVSPYLRIWDNGRGVDSSVEESLFQPFVTLKPKVTGRGLGLFIATNVVESMGCSIALLHSRNRSGRRYIFELDLSGIAHG